MTITIDRSEPCEQCGDSGDSGLYWPEPGRLVVWCGRCVAAWQAARLAAKEAALLADWGTMKDKRTA